MKKIMSDIVAKTPDADVAADLDATLAFAGGEGEADTARAAVTGFCWGGRAVLALRRAQSEAEGRRRLVRPLGFPVLRAARRRTRPTSSAS